MYTFKIASLNQPATQKQLDYVNSLIIKIQKWSAYPQAFRSEGFNNDETEKIQDAFAQLKTLSVLTTWEASSLIDTLRVFDSVNLFLYTAIKAIDTREMKKAWTSADKFMALLLLKDTMAILTAIKYPDYRDISGNFVDRTPDPADE